MRPKCIFIIGSPCSGSKLIAKIIAHVLGGCKYGSWDGMKWAKSKNKNLVCHFSMPAGDIKKEWPPINKWIKKYGDAYDLCFILTVRDSSCSSKSRLKHRTSLKVQQEENKQIKANMQKVIDSGAKYFIWSYETFMFLRGMYLQELWKALDIESNFIPELKDGNIKYIIKRG
jgi:hypothetical protein